MSTPTPPDPQATLPAEVRALVALRDWRGVVARLQGVAVDDLLPDPEIAFHYADASRRVGDTPRALEIGRTVEGWVRRSGDSRLLLRVLNVVGMTLFEMGRPREAEQYFGELLDSANEWEDEESAARASNNLGVLANVRGRRELALTYYQRALASYQRLGYLRGLAQTHYNLGISYRDLDFDREADAHYERAIAFAEGSASEDVIALAEMERAVLRTRSGDGELADSMARRALARFERIGDPTGAAQAVRVLAGAHRVNGDDEAAGKLLLQALAAARVHQDPLLHAEVQRDRAALLRDRGEHDAAAEAMRDAASHFDEIGAEAEAAACRSWLVELANPPPPPADP